MSWALSTKDGEEVVTEYCSKHSFSLAVAPNLDSIAFHLERKKAFDVACRVWNAVDKSSKGRIQMADESALDFVTVTAISHEGSDVADGASWTESQQCNGVRSADRFTGRWLVGIGVTKSLCSELGQPPASFIFFMQSFRPEPWGY